MCGRPVLAKCGEMRAHHWAHESLGDCDTWASDETAWHLGWKSYCADRGAVAELTLASKYPRFEGQRHRADIVCGSVVVEFQSNYLSPQAIAEREAFYGNVIWVYRADRWLDRIEYITPRGAEVARFRWKHGAQSMAAHRRPAVWWDMRRDPGDEITLDLVRVWVDPTDGSMWGSVRLRLDGEEWWRWVRQRGGPNGPPGPRPASPLVICGFHAQAAAASP